MPTETSSPPTEMETHICSNTIRSTSESTSKGCFLMTLCSSKVGSLCYRPPIVADKELCSIRDGSIAPQCAFQDLRHHPYILRRLTPVASTSRQRPPASFKHGTNHTSLVVYGPRIMLEQQMVCASRIVRTKTPAINANMR